MSYTHRFLDTEEHAASSGMPRKAIFCNPSTLRYVETVQSTMPRVAFQIFGCHGEYEDTGEKVPIHVTSPSACRAAAMEWLLAHCVAVAA